MTRTLPGLLLLVSLGGAAMAQEPIPHGQSAPPGPALTPEQAIRKMTVPEGFRVEIVASEPDLVNPVAMTFDEKGRVWVTESLEYPRRAPGPGRDRVKILEDKDGDGRAESVAIFAEGLNIPSGIAVGHGGVWVANSPDLLFYPDADRDGRPDGPPEVVVSGFGRDDTHELPNSLTWGPDGWLYGWNGVFNPSRIEYRGKTYAFTCAIFRIHPKTRDFQVFCEGTSNPWGIAINEEGDFFASACVIDHLWHLVEGAYYIRQGGPYPPFTWPMGSIVDHKHQKAAYCGIHYFDSPAYPEKYRRKLYMGNIHANGINVDTLTRDGSTYKGGEGPDFLAANDAWFMPVSQKTGPDGSLYILDWYDRYHCYQDANRDPEGIDRLKGRLYRVRYGETPRRVGFDLAKENDDALIKLLFSENVYDRDIAQRLLTERLAARTADAATAGRLQALALDPKAGPRAGRMHALWTVVGAGPLDPRFHGAVLGDADPAIRAWGVRAAGNMGKVEPNIAVQIDQILGGATHDPAVDLQAAIALPKLVRSDADLASGLVRLLEASGQDRLLPHLIWQRLLPKLDQPAFLAEFTMRIEQTKAADSPAIAAIWPRLVDRVVEAEQADGRVLAALAKHGIGRLREAPAQRALVASLTRAIRDGRLSGTRLDGLRKEFQPIAARSLGDPADPLRSEYLKLAGAWGDTAALDQLAAILADNSAAANARIEALDVLAGKDRDGLAEAIARLLADATLKPEARGRALAALGRSEDPRIAPVVLAAYDRLDPESKPKAIELLTQRLPWSRDLVAAVEGKSLPAAAVNVNQLRKLQGHKEPELAARVRAIWGAVREGRNRQREEVVAQMRRYIGQNPGDPYQGRQVFDRVCGQCHKLHGIGQDVGPELTLNGRNDLDQLVSNVFDPSLVIGAGYQATIIATTDGRVLTGLIAEDSPQRLVIKLSGGKLETIDRKDVDELKTSEVSFMPEDLEKQLQPQEIADLFALLGLDKPPGDRNARRLPGLPEPKRR